MRALAKATIGARELDRIQGIFRLSDTELARLFGVSRTAVGKWRMRGVPVERRADVDRVSELATYFRRRFIPARIPQIVRNPGKGLAGKSVLQTLAQHGVEPVYAYLEQLFSYTPR
jgi:hypothetical protein